MTDHIARAETTIAAPADRVWKALTDPAQVKQYMMGATVASDYEEGSPITWKGEIKGKSFADHGVVKRVTPNQLLEYTHFSPMEGKPDSPENYHTVTVQLTPDGSATRVSLAQTNNATDDARKHSEDNWNAMLAGMKKIVEAK